MSRAAASAIIRGLLRSGPQSRRFWKCRLCVSLGSSALIPAHRQSPPPRPRKAVRSLALATATLTVSRGSSRALISSRAWLGSCPCCSGVSKSRPACRLVLFGSALSVCSFRAMLSNKEQVAAPQLRVVFSPGLLTSTPSSLSSAVLAGPMLTSSGARERRQQSPGPWAREPWFPGPCSKRRSRSIPDDPPVTGSRLLSVRATQGMRSGDLGSCPCTSTRSLLSVSSSAASIYLLSVGQWSGL